MRSTAAVLAALALSAAAHAQLDGTVMTIEQDFSDCLTPEVAPGDYTYGETLVLKANNDPARSWKLSGPDHFPGYNNSLLCDYSTFKLGKNAHTDTYFFVREIDLKIAKGSVEAFNAGGKKIGVVQEDDDGFGFYVKIAVDDILSGPVQMAVAWNNQDGPPPCYPDLDGDGTLDLFDFLRFTNLFNAQDRQADCDGDGAFDLFDFLCFTNAFNAGC